MSRTQLFRFIGGALIMDDSPEMVGNIRSIVEEGKISWEDFIRITSHDLVLPALYGNFKRNELLHFLPSDLVDYFHYLYELNVSRNTEIASQAAEISGLLEKNGICSVFLKGTCHLLSGLYRDTADRIIGDIDLLIQIQDVPLAFSVLEQAGYSRSKEDKKPFNEQHHHFPGIFKPGNPASVEIHHQPLHGSYSAILSTDVVFSERIKCPDWDVFIPSINHQMIINFVHSQLVDHGLAYGRPSFKDLFDFYLLTKANPFAGDLNIKGYSGKLNSFRRVTSFALGQDQIPEFKVTFFSWISLFRYRLLISSGILSEINRMTIINYLRVILYTKLLVKYPFSRLAREEMKYRTGKKVFNRFRKVAKTSA